MFNWRVLDDDELPDVTSPSWLWDCVRCWREGKDYDPQEPAQIQEHLLDV